MPYLMLEDDLDVADGLIALGTAVREARRVCGLSQDGLERRSGVDQTAISRLERGLAPRFPVVRLVRIDLALGGRLGLVRRADIGRRGLGSAPWDL